MAIDGKLRKSLQSGMTLVGTYKQQQHRAEVVTGEDGKLRFRLADGREFSSPSAAGSAVMGGIACNGWRFWSIATGETPAKPARSKANPAKEATPTKTAGTRPRRAKSSSEAAQVQAASD
jgi:hypothetical protein